MKGNEVVWRTLADGAIDGHRRWDSIADLAFKSGVAGSTTHLALQKPIEIGAVRTHRSGGFSVVNPEKLLVLSCAWRNLPADVITKTSRAGLDVLRQQAGHVVLGGPDAAIFLLGGINTVADFSQQIAYATDPAVYAPLPAGEDVTVFKLDKRAAVEWCGHTSFTQTYIDLFATPGWQATEFRTALRDRFVRERDWDQKDV